MFVSGSVRARFLVRVRGFSFSSSVSFRPAREDNINEIETNEQKARNSGPLNDVLRLEDRRYNNLRLREWDEFEEDFGRDLAKDPPELLRVLDIYCLSGLKIDTQDTDMNTGIRT